MIRLQIVLLGVLTLSVISATRLDASPSAAQKPNILVIVADDMGYADSSMQGCTDVRTPHIDSLAKNGVRFTNGYVSGCVCSPSRAGLISGRYQQRFGHDANPRREFGLDANATTIANRLRAAGYVTGITGKWHLGEQKPQMPLARGFDEFYGILPHGIAAEKRGSGVAVYRGADQVATPPDHTVKFGEEAVEFIGRHHGRPWFLYLPFTAVHSPHVAPESYLRKFAHIEDRSRRQLCAMISVMDDQVGAVLAKLRALKQEEDTLIFFFSDNGGPSSRAVHNGPLRGGKWTVWEGGIRVPFAVQWKGRIKPGRTLDTPVIQLDVLPTALAAAGAAVEPEWRLDGVDLLPWLEGKAAKLSREALFWRFGVQYAVRQGDWKLLKPSLHDAPRLVNLATDLGETKDLSAEYPEKMKQMTALWEAWNAENIPPRWEDPRWNGGEERKATKGQRRRRDAPQ